MRLDLREMREMAGLGVDPNVDTAYDSSIDLSTIVIPDTNVLTTVPGQTYGPTTYVVGAPPVAAPAPSGPSFGSWLQNLISGGAKTAEQIYVGQNIPRGVYTSVNPKTGEQTTYVQPEGTAQNIFSASQTGVTGQLGGTATGFLNTGAGLAIAAGAALLLVFMMMRGKKD